MADANDGGFPLSPTEVGLLKQVADSVREELLTASPAFIRDAALALFCLERLPKASPAVITIGWQTESINGCWEWADLSISEEEVRASVGAHSYDSEIGGDTESKTLFYSYQDGTKGGDLETWVERADALGGFSKLTIVDEFGDEHIDWYN